MISLRAWQGMGQKRYFLLSALLILFDQLTKGWAMATLKTAGSKVAVLPFFFFFMVWNYGVSFGMFNKKTDGGPGLLILLSLAITLWFSRWLMQGASRVQSICLAMVIGGALGNVIDRLRFGAVVDFLDFHLFEYHWPAFNVADSCIVLGVAGLIIHSVFLEKRVENLNMKKQG